jgi:hypothetical protein
MSAKGAWVGRDRRVRRITEGAPNEISAGPAVPPYLGGD